MKIRQICIGVVLASACLTCSLASSAQNESSKNPLRASFGQTILETIADLPNSKEKAATAKNDLVAATNFNSAAVQSPNQSQGSTSPKSVIRWADNKALIALPSTTETQLLMGTPEVLKITTDSKNFVDTPVQSASSTQDASKSKVEIIRTQASEDVFYDASQIPTADAQAVEPAENLEPTAAPEETYTEGEPVWDSSMPCCDMGCDVCCGGPNCCCSRCCCRPCMLVGGVDAVFLGVDTNGYSPSFYFQDFGTTQPGSYDYTNGNYLVPGGDIDDFYIAPRIWAGVQGCRWGIIGRYFHLRAGEHDSQLYNPATSHYGTSGIGHDAYSTFDAYYTDIEVTRNFCCCCAKHQFSFGARYALIEEAQGITVMGDLPDIGGRLNGGARTKRSAHGTGITFGINGRKPLFCNSCAHWFYSARGSVLWGCTHNEAETWAQIEDTSAPLLEYGAGSKDGAYSLSEDDLFIGEFQLGLQWDFALRCLPAKSFFRAAFEYQYWDSSVGVASAGSIAGIESGSPLTLDGQGIATAFAPGIRADLIGFHIGTGFTW